LGAGLGAGLGACHAPLLVAVNYHAFELCEPDFVVYNDHPENDARMVELIKTLNHGDTENTKKTIKVSSEPSSDVEFDVEVWTGFYSSNTATWFALWCGCDPVILCGMDCYQGEKKYCHEYEDKPHYHYGLEFHMRPWIEEGRNKLPHVERVKVMSGPLVGVFGAYDQKINAETRRKSTQSARRYHFEKNL
jgi:hypothetical protein